MGWPTTLVEKKAPRLLVYAQFPCSIGRRSHAPPRTPDTSATVNRQLVSASVSGEVAVASVDGDVAAGDPDVDEDEDCPLGPTSLSSFAEHPEMSRAPARTAAEIDLNRVIAARLAWGPKTGRNYMRTRRRSWAQILASDSSLAHAIRLGTPADSLAGWLRNAVHKAATCHDRVVSRPAPPATQSGMRTLE